MMQSSSYSFPLATSAVLGHAFDAGRAVDQGHVRPVERVEVLIVEARPLAQVPVVGLQRLRDVGVGDESPRRASGAPPSPSSRTPRPCRMISSSVMSGVDCGVGDLRHVVRPAVVGEILIDRPPEHHGREVLHPLPLPARAAGSRRSPRGVGRFPRTPIGRRRALEHVQVLRGLGQRWDGLDRAGTGSDDADDLVGQVGRGVRSSGCRRCTRSPSVPSGTTCP